MRGGPEPLRWGMFAAGGMVAALVLPALVLLLCLAAPLGLADPVPHPAAEAVVSHLAFRLALVVVVPLGLLHAAHRVLAAFMDFGLRPFGTPVALVLFSGAMAGTAFAVWTALTL